MPIRGKGGKVRSAHAPARWPKNTPFCHGTHWSSGFKGDHNGRYKYPVNSIYFCAAISFWYAAEIVPLLVAIGNSVG
jgi:hypothetical protein